MRFRSWLGGAAIVGAACWVAPLAHAEVEYVRICDAYGAGFFYVPGTDTCLKIGGYVRFDSQTLTGGGTTQTNFATRYNINLDTRSQTAYGTLRSYIALQGDTSDHTPGTDLSFIKLDTAKISLGNWEAGYRWSASDFGGGFTDNRGLTSETYTNQIRFSPTVGGLGFVLAIEDPRDRWGTSSPDKSPPDIIGRVNIEEAWGSATLGLGAGQIKTGTTWGAKASVDINLNALTIGDRIRIALGFAHDSGEWLGVSDNAPGDWYGALGSVKLVLDPNRRIAWAGTASIVDGPGTFADRWNVSSGVYWNPVNELKVGGEISYTHYTSPSPIDFELRLMAKRWWGGDDEPYEGQVF